MNDTPTFPGKTASICLSCGHDIQLPYQKAAHLWLPLPTILGNFPPGRGGSNSLGSSIPGITDRDGTGSSRLVPWMAHFIFLIYVDWLFRVSPEKFLQDHHTISKNCLVPQNQKPHWPTLFCKMNTTPPPFGAEIT